ncbi:MAG: alpha/beta fold hydrolase, partial [Cyanobacteria bacterium J06559_3]
MMNTNGQLVIGIGIVWGLSISAAMGEVSPARAIATPARLDSATADSIDCPVNVEDLGRVSCGQLTVPENWDQKDSSRLLRLTYVILHGTGDAIAADPVIWLEGGPGNSPIYDTRSYAELLSNIRTKRDVILLAQRGTEFSEPLDCIAPILLDVIQNSGGAEEWEVRLSSARDAVESIDYTAATTPEEYVTLIRESGQLENLRRCGQFWNDRGVDLGQYNSRRSAQDIVALVNALGYEQYNLLGMSYGGRLALTVMRDHPTSGLRSVVLDSAVPPNVNMHETSAGFVAIAAERLFADCQANSACAQAFPNLRETFLDLTTQFEEGTLAEAWILTRLFNTINKNP